MEGRVRTKIRKLRRSMSLTGAIVATAVGVILPVLLSTSVGIVALALGKTSESTLFGVLIICFATAAIGSAIVVTVLLGRRNRIARLQADFMANVTHELRTPLCSIRMYAQTLQMGRLNEQPELVEKSLKTIIRETEWLEGMIDRVLTWRAASKDREAPSMTGATLTAAVRSAIDRFKRMVSLDDMELDVSLTSQKDVLHDDEGIQSLLLNLLVNAYKYTGNNKNISVRLVDLEESVELSVEDNGIGIPTNEAGKIFDPFYRVDSRLSGKASGAGLGLAIVRHQVKLHGGEVFVESEEDKGTRFIVQFPTIDALKENQ